MSIIKCPKCGNNCDDNSKFCGGCGYPISAYIDGLKKSNESKGVTFIGNGIPTSNNNNNDEKYEYNSMPNQNVKKPKPGNAIVMWIFVGLMAFATFTSMVLEGWASAVIFAFLALFISPLRNKLPINFSKGAVIAIGIVGYIIASMLFPKTTDSEKEYADNSTNLETAEQVVTVADAQEDVDNNVASTENSEDSKEKEDEFLVLPYPDETEIIDVDDFKSFYKNYSDGDDGKWYRINAPVYSVEDGEIIIHEDLGKILGMITVHFADASATDSLHVGDEVSFVAHSKYKFMNMLSMESAYLQNASETANTIYDDQVVIINDYVFFYTNYDSHDIGKNIQITAKVDSIDDSNITIKEGLPDKTLSMIVAYLADGESTGNYKAGDTVTFYGKAGSKMGRSLLIDDAHIGESPLSNRINYEDSESYEKKVEESQKEIEYIKVTVKTMLDDMDSNPVTAKEKYIDQYLEVTGVVCDIAGNGKRIDIGTSKNSTLNSVFCSLKDSAQIEKVKQISNGDSITVRGKCFQAGKILGYGLDDVEIISN